MATVLTPDSTGRARIVDVEDLVSWAGSLPTGGGLAVDTETSGFEWDATVRMVQFGHRNEGFAVVTDGRRDGTLNRVLSAYSGPLIFHNASFDIRQLLKLDLDPDRLWTRAIDTFVMAHVLHPDRFHNLDALAQSVLHENSDGYKKLFRKMMRKRKWTWATVPKLLLTPYGVNDAIYTFRLYEEFCAQLTPKEWDVVMKEMEVALAVWKVANRGMRLDIPYTEGLAADWKQALADDRAYFTQYALAPPDVSLRPPTVGPKEAGDSEQFLTNPNSNAQVARALVKFGWQPSARTPTGKAKLDKAVLETLAPDYELVRRLLEYKRKTKWLAAYVENCLEQVDRFGRVHASYNILGAKTGRMSCSNPPLQQLPKGGGGEIRRLFIATEGCRIASVDYSAIELRLAGALSGEPRIIQAYADGEDIYQQVADDLGITRPHAKVIVLASLYGAGGRKIGLSLGISPRDAQVLVNEFWRRYAILGRWVSQQSSSVEAGAPVYSKWGRRLRPHSPYAAANAIIQGTAAEVLKEGILRLEIEGLLDYVVALVHDEVVLDVPEGDAVRITQRVAEVLRDDSFAIPLLAEASVYGRSWGDGYPG